MRKYGRYLLLSITDFSFNISNLDMWSSEISNNSFNRRQYFYGCGISHYGSCSIYKSGTKCTFNSGEFKLILYNNNKKSFEMAKHSLNFLISNYLIGQYSHSWVWICSGDGFNLWKNTSCGNTKRFQR